MKGEAEHKKENYWERSDEGNHANTVADDKLNLRMPGDEEPLKNMTKEVEMRDAMCSNRQKSAVQGRNHMKGLCMSVN